MNATLTTTEPLSAAERWTNAGNEIRNQDVQIIENIDACCPSCIREDLFEIFQITDGTPLVAWTYGGDGHAYEWDSTDTMVYKDDRSPKECIYFHQGNYYLSGSGSIVAAAFRANGFVVRWDGGEHDLVEVFPNGK